MHNTTISKLSSLPSDTPIIVTFGCSWTYGVGVNYEQGMSEDTYLKNAWSDSISDELSFRGIIAKEFNLFNLNFAEGGSSNQKQFRYAREFFTNPMVKKHHGRIIVLWGITSVYRNELWSNTNVRYDSFKYDETLSKLQKLLFKETFNYDTEVKKLSEDMEVWNGYFKNMGIKNLWFDTFNTHEYPLSVSNLINGDMMSTMSGMESHGYHFSSWVNDIKPTINKLVDSGILNPYSFHPTKLGHQKIAEILEPRIKQMVV